ncbi:MAG: GLUG motif-containing protein [Planctomycetota bacterium]|jgi:hypothetical protein
MDTQRELKTAGVMVVLVCVFCAGAFGQPWEGNGVEGDPYQIWTAVDMQEIGADANYWDAHFKLMADIDLGGFTGTSFNIIGTRPDNPFTGVFDGNGYTFSNFTYSTSDYAFAIGLFGFVEGAEIKNLRVVNPSVYAEEAEAVGRLIGWTGAEGVKITDCYVEGGSVSGGEFVHHVGGLAGVVQGGGSVVNCYSSATVSSTGYGYVGGLIGAIGLSTVSHCYSTGSVSGGGGVGGLMGGHFDEGGLPRFPESRTAIQRAASRERAASAA